MLDEYGRTIDYARISLTDRCNLKCIYCMPENLTCETMTNRLSCEDYLKIIQALSRLGITKVRFTGGEPLLFTDLDRLIAETSNIMGISDISVTTNGIQLSERLEGLIKAGLTRININISSLNTENYRRITRGGDLKRVLKGLDQALELGMKPVKINTVLIKGVNDLEIDNFIRLAAAKPVHVRFIELMPIGEGKHYYDNGGRVSFENILKDHPELKPVENEGRGIVTNYTMEGALGSIGFIEPVSCKFCNNCNKIRVTAGGTVKPCLHSEEELDIISFINEPKKLEEVLKQAILKKTKEHHIEEENTTRSQRPMYQIGG